MCYVLIVTCLYSTVNDYKYKIEVDGGITADNVSKVIEAGADMIVSGSYIYKSPDKFEAIRTLRG